MHSGNFPGRVTPVHSYFDVKKIKNFSEIFLIFKKYVWFWSKKFCAKKFSWGVFYAKNLVFFKKSATYYIFALITILFDPIFVRNPFPGILPDLQAKQALGRPLFWERSQAWGKPPDFPKKAELVFYYVIWGYFWKKWSFLEQNFIFNFLWKNTHRLLIYFLRFQEVSNVECAV